MCVLHFGQIVEVAAELISCVALQSKHSMTELWCLVQKPSSFRKSDGSGAASTGSSFGRSRTSTFGAEGAKCAPHWRHIVLFAAAYSICLKPQCGQSTLTFAGDDFATGRRAKGDCLDSSAESGFRRRRRLFVPDDLRSRRRGSSGLAGANATGDLGLADEGGAFFDDEARRFQIALERATRFQFATLAHGDVALDLAVNRDRFRFDLAANVRVLTDGQDAIRIDFALHFAVDQQFLFEI